MSALLRYFFLLACVLVSANASPRLAIATMSPGLSLLNSPLFGSIAFAEVEDQVQIAGAVVGVPAATDYRLAIHELGDITTCNTVGNELAVASGQLDAAKDAIVLTASPSNEVGVVNITGHLEGYTLRGSNSILGRSIILVTQQGNWGRVACGVVGIRGGDWSSAVTNTPSLLLFVVAALFAYSRA